MKSQRGWLLLELLLVMSISLWLMRFAFASYDRLLVRQALDSQLVRIAAGLLKSRSEAITRNQPVQVCLANLKSNLDIQGCQQTLVQTAGYPVPEGVLFFIDQPGGRSGVYDSKEAYDSISLSSVSRIKLFASVASFRVRPSGTLSVSGGVHYIARDDSSGQCRRLKIAVTGFRQLEDC